MKMYLYSFQSCPQCMGKCCFLTSYPSCWAFNEINPPLKGLVTSEKSRLELL